MHADEESAGKIIKVIRETQPEKYEYDNISEEFFADVMIELDTVSEIKYSCEIICDKDTGVYYLVRYDVIDGCYYKHKI